MSSRLCLYYRTLLLSRDGLLSFDEYSSFYVRLSKLLLAPHFHLALAKANAQADWDKDMRESGGAGERSMDCDTFCHSLFEMVDMYVLLHDAQQVVFILNKAYALLTQTSASPYPSSSSSSMSSATSPSVVTFVPLAAINEHTPFNAHGRHNIDYNQYAHTAAHSLHHRLHDDDIEFTVPLLPPLSVDALPASTTAGKDCAVGGLKQGPTRNGLHCSIGAMDEFITLHSPYAAMLPAQWSVARWQRDNHKQQAAARVEAVGDTRDEEKQNSGVDELNQQSQQQPWQALSHTEEPFVVRERRERAASRSHHVPSVILGGRRNSSGSSGSRRGSVVMDIDDGEGDSAAASATQVQREPQSAVQRLSRFI